MHNARHSFTLLWKRLVAALSLIAAAVLAPGVPTGGGAGALGSRVGNNSATVAGAASAMVAKVAGVVQGEQGLHRDAWVDPPAKAYGIAPSYDYLAWPLRPLVASPMRSSDAPPRTHASRAGPARAPPLA